MCCHCSLSYNLQTTYTKGTRAELARDYDQAFRLYVNAAAAFLHLSKTFTYSSKPSATITARDAQMRDKCKQDAKRCMDRAERIKANRPASELRPVMRNVYDEGMGPTSVYHRAAMPHLQPSNTTF
jgi:hypothetical protein